MLLDAIDSLLIIGLVFSLPAAIVIGYLTFRKFKGKKAKAIFISVSIFILSFLIFMWAIMHLIVLLGST